MELVSVQSPGAAGVGLATAGSAVSGGGFWCGHMLERDIGKSSTQR